MRLALILLRVLAALAVAVAVIATYATARQPVNPFNFFGFFTIQSNLVAGGAFVVGAIGLTRRIRSAPLFRAAATTYIALTGVVYNTLLTGLAGGVALPWANTVLHSVIPLYAVADWVLVADRPRLSFRALWVVVPYPLVWLAVVLVRGATDGWVPYPFLDPSLGYGVVALWCAVITAAVLVLAAGVWWASRARVLLRRPATR